ncbi:hypothetical protein B5G10_11475 [Barnesiella sp. An55]|nr:hypothetical protein B5G10_11475 [Barnesiella sp. An55]
MTIQELKEKISGFIKNIPTDKKKHLIAGFIICAVVSMIFGYIIGRLYYRFCGSSGSRCRERSIRPLYEERNGRVCRFGLYGSRCGLLPYTFSIDNIAFLRICFMCYLGFTKASYS